MRNTSLILLVGSMLFLAGCASIGSGGSEVIVLSPAPDAIVTSPLTVSGQARGRWFFEANIPVSLEDEDGTVITQVGAMAESEWMTPDFVRFSGVLVFTTDKARGFLVVRKDNPSALPEHDAEFRVPVRFQ